MKIEYEIDITPTEGEIFKFLNSNSLKSSTVAPHRYYISNKGRLIDLSKDSLISITNGRVTIVNTGGHRINISIDTLLKANFPEEFDSTKKRKKFVQPSQENIDEMIRLYTKENIGVPEIAIKFNITQARVRNYLSGHYNKLRSACIAKHGNYELSIAFMEALDNIPQSVFSENSMYSVLKSIAEDEFGIKFDMNLYHKTYAYITGRSSYIVVKEESSTTSPKGRRSKQTEMESPSDKEGEDIV